MSKWIDKDLFNKFQTQKLIEKEESKSNRRAELLWATPEKGTTENPKIYEGRFLPDKKGNFYKRYYYHMWRSGENWIFALCPKSFNYKDYCPICSSTVKLYAGSESDKSQANLIKRKEKFVGNFYIVSDPRDMDKENIEEKVNGKTKLYEFPGKIETLIASELRDTKQGYGPQIFDPGEEGRNFIIKVLSTKKDDKGKTWPDYTNSGFSRVQSAIGSDQEIQKILDATIDLDEYVNNMKLSNRKIVDILKNEFLWDFIADEATKFGYVSQLENTEAPQQKKADVVEKKADVVEKKETTTTIPTTTTPSKVSESETISDSDLLAELDNL
jgi:hypothetical protein